MRSRVVFAGAAAERYAPPSYYDADRRRRVSIRRPVTSRARSCRPSAPSTSLCRRRRAGWARASGIRRGGSVRLLRCGSPVNGVYSSFGAQNPVLNMFRKPLEPNSAFVLGCADPSMDLPGASPPRGAVRSDGRLTFRHLAWRKRLVVDARLLRLALAFLLAAQLGPLDVRIVRPVGRLLGVGDVFRRRQHVDLIARRQHQRRTLAVFDAGLVLAQPQALQNAFEDFGVQQFVVVIVRGMRERSGAAHHHRHAERGGESEPGEFALGLEAHHADTRTP